MKSNHEMEYELTYLAKFIPSELNNIKFKNMVDVYFPTDLEIHPRLRLRQQGDQYQITKKTPVNKSDASVHQEVTIELDKQEFLSICNASSRKIEKVRYYMEIEGYKCEVDVFKNALEGLVLIDFEFKSKSEMEQFTPPKCCLVDVTQEKFIAGGLLAGKSYKDIKRNLDIFNYVKL